MWIPTVFEKYNYGFCRWLHNARQITRRIAEKYWNFGGLLWSGSWPQDTRGQRPYLLYQPYERFIYNQWLSFMDDLQHSPQRWLNLVVVRCTWGLGIGPRTGISKWELLEKVKGCLQQTGKASLKPFQKADILGKYAILWLTYLKTRLT